MQIFFYLGYISFRRQIDTRTLDSVNFRESHERNVGMSWNSKSGHFMI